MSAAPHDHDGTDTFDPTCQRCRDGWQAAYDQAQCDYRETEFSTGQTSPGKGDQVT
ncbi:hypothetical protein OG693_39150 (plasmid) [Streptomyces sp. NBC_01259]|uniref:hypothetical protein n=1 Tax=Streptomyces sp. NBC_01259 TaxID=2903800 RepID=UPI0032503679